MKVDVTDICSVAYGLIQWDYGQVLILEGLSIPDDTEIHFCQNGTAYTDIILSGTVKIPDYLLQYPDKIAAYLYVADTDSGKTIRKIVLPVKPREKPGDYVTPEEPAYSRLLPPGGDDGDMLIKTYEGFAWMKPEEPLMEATELDVINMLESIFG